jgi:signal transduction histidine kinase
VDLLATAGQRVAAAKACLVAGKRSQETAAFETGLRYFTAGTALLPEDAWDTRYDLAFPLHFEQMASTFACGHYERTLTLSHLLRASAESILDQFEVIWIQMAVYFVLDQLSEARKMGVDALHLCGIQVPRKVSRRATDRQYQLIKELIGARTADEIAQLPKVTDAMIHQSIRMLAMMSNGTDDVTKAFLLFKIAELSLKHGLVAESAAGFSGAGFLMQIDHEKSLDEAYELGLIALRIGERFEDVLWKANTFGYFTTYLNHWRHHLKTSLKLEETYEELMSSLSTRKGYAIMYGPVKSYLRLACGDVIGEVLRQAGELLPLAEVHDMRFATNLLQLLLGTAHALQGSSDATMKVDERRILSDIEYGRQDIILAQSFLDCMRLYILDRPQEALYAAMEGFRWMDTKTEALDFLFPEQTFYHGLILASVYPKAKETEEIEYKSRLQRILRLMRMWAEGCPDNYLHKYLLLQAEYTRLFGKNHYKVADLYDEAIDSAKEHGFLHNQAVANECAAKFYLTWNKDKVARGYLTEARYLYEQWGAFSKVKQLEEKYPYLLMPRTTPGFGHSPLSVSTESEDQSESGEVKLHSLDLATILKTSQAISSEIQLDKLLSTMLRLVIENAGAEKGFWILPQDGEWSVTASADVNGHSQEMPSVPIRRADKLSFGVVHYTIRTKEVVVLHNACREGRFVRDPYVRRTKVKSILCFPVVKHGAVIAILYLENNLATHAFTADRVELLELLSGQAAISIENARMYASLDGLVQERTDELHRAQQQMMESEKMASLGQLTAGVAHEMNNPINFVVSSTAPLRRDMDDLMELLNRYRQTVEAQSLFSHFEQVKSFEEEIDLRYVAEEIQQLLRGIEEGGKRTAEIIKGLRTFSRLDEDEVKKASVTEGIDSTLTLLRKKVESRIRIIRDYDEIPDIDCYPGKLNQVYMNLLSNAVEAIPEEGEIRISVKQIGNHVCIQIADTGVGMPKEVIRRIFEPFFTTKEVGVGTGLGLSISYGIIERHNGSIEVDSAPGKGTAFTITLPIRQANV